MRSIYIRILLLVVSSTLIVGAADAQAPQRTTATYDDWTVSCATQAQTQMICDLSQAQRVQGQSNPTTQVTISRPEKNKQYKIGIVVPADVWLQTGVRLTVEENGPPTVATFTLCLPNRCLAEANLSDEMMKRLRTRTDPWKLEFKEASQRDVSMPVSAKGFGQALTFMEKQ
jgi:invasion protein IalB